MGPGYIFAYHGLVIIAYPYPSGDLRGKADKPVVGAVIRGAGLSSGGTIKPSCSGTPSGPLTDNGLEHSGHDVGGLGAQHLFPLRGFVLLQDVSITIGDLEEIFGFHLNSLIGKDGES